MLRRLPSLLLLALPLLVAACGDDNGPSDPEPIDPEPVAVIAFVAAPELLTVGDDARLEAVTRGASGKVLTGRTIEWRSSNTSVATVDDDGVVTATAEGVTVLEAASEGKVARTTLHVTTEIVPVSRIEIVEGQTTVRVGAALALHARALAADGSVLGGRQLRWRTGNIAVANVTVDGFVTGVSAGQAPMTVEAEGKEAQVTVQVLPNVLRIEMSPEELFLTVGEHGDVQATVIGDGDHALDLPVTWSSTDESVATVSASGRVTAHRSGATLIKAAADGVWGTTVLVVGDASVYALATVNGQEPPATMFTHQEPDGMARYDAQAGTLSIRDDGRWEQTFWFLVYRENQVMTGGQYATSGEWSYEEATATYLLQDLSGRPSFTATRRADGTLLVRQHYLAGATEATLVYAPQ